MVPTGSALLSMGSYWGIFDFPDEQVLTYLFCFIWKLLYHFNLIRSRPRDSMHGARSLVTEGNGKSRQVEKEGLWDSHTQRRPGKRVGSMALQVNDTLWFAQETTLCVCLKMPLPGPQHRPNGSFQGRWEGDTCALNTFPRRLSCTIQSENH